MYKKGQKIWFAEEKRPYTIRACDERYLICTKPYNFKKDSVIYTIVDLKENVRGTDGYSIGSYSYYSQEDCDAYMDELREGERLEAMSTDDLIYDLGAAHVSYRNRIQLNITKVR